MAFLGKIFGGGGGGDFQASGTDIQQGAGLGDLANSLGRSNMGLDQQQAFLAALQGQGGVQNQSDVFNQLGNITAGQGPNPAQAMLAQATGQNTANQAALMGSQRGASANPALIARLAAQQGANNQQNAAGQAATLQANQSLNALNQMGGIAGQQVGNLGNAGQAFSQAAQNLYGTQQQAVDAANRNRVGMQSNINSANAGIQQQVAKQQGDLLGGILGGAGKALSFGLFAQGGEVPADPSAPASRAGRFLSGYADGGVVSSGPGFSLDAGKAMAKEEPKKMDTPVMGEENDLSKGASAFAQGIGSAISGKKPMARGGVAVVPGKASVKGDSFKNDKVPAMLSPGEVIIPRSIAQGPNAPERAAEFVRQVLAKKGNR